jgi:IS1 family transposase
MERHIISKKKTTHIERCNRDFRTHLKRLTRKIGCFSKKDNMRYGFIETHVQYKNAA